MTFNRAKSYQYQLYASYPYLSGTLLVPEVAYRPSGSPALARFLRGPSDQEYDLHQKHIYTY